MSMPTDIEYDAFEQNQSESGFGDSASEVFSTTSYMEDPIHVASSSEISCNEIGSNMLPNKAFAVYYAALHNDENEIIKGNYDRITSHIDSGSLEDYESADFNKEANDLSHQVVLEDNCVIVDYSTIPHDDVSTEPPNQPSFKRTILNALFPKKRLAMEYKKLVILEGHNATKCCQGASLAAPRTMLLKDSDQTIQSSDSEWELL
ncbi:uncharacterized protein E5676_scaffold416G00800 [Cucumis melo var. makuwa]|nr:uncharacterized protein E5676_scaffold416G00800 [Cucumis melo var. makuwa]